MGDTEKAAQLQEALVKNLEARNQRSGRSNTSEDSNESSDSDSKSESKGGSSGDSGSGQTAPKVAGTAPQAKILEYTHPSKAASIASTNITATSPEPPAPMNAVADKFDAAKMVAKEQQSYIQSTPDSEEERKRKLLAQTMATRPHKPATRRGAKKAE